MTGTITGSIASELKPELRNLVDNRLDAIDRILIDARLPRTERTNILSDVESQIYDMIASSIGDREPTRRDVLAVLAKLDPPEAYAPDEEHEPAASPAAAPAPAAVESSLPPSAPRTVTLSSSATPEKGRTPVTSILAVTGGLATFFIGLPGTVLSAMFTDSGEAIILFLLSVFFLLAIGLPSFILGILGALAVRKPGSTYDNLTCPAIGIAALPVCLATALMVLATIDESIIGIVFMCFFFVVLGCVGAVHVVYRLLEVLCVRSPASPPRAA